MGCAVLHQGMGGRDGADRTAASALLSASCSSSPFLSLSLPSCPPTFFPPMSALQVVAVKGDMAKVELMNPVCTQEEEKIALSRRVDKHWRLIGWGRIKSGVKVADTA